MTSFIEWSPLATEELDSILDFLHDKWGQKSAKQFIQRLNSVLENIVKRPNIYPSTQLIYTGA